MKIEARIIKKYRYSENYTFLVMENEEGSGILYYVRENGRDELLMAKRQLNVTMDDTEVHLSEIEKLADNAILRYQAAYPSEQKVSTAPPIQAPHEPLEPMKSNFKKLGSVEREEKAKAMSMAMTQKNSMIDFRYNRQGNLVKHELEGNQSALMSDVYTMIDLVNRRMNDDVRPILLAELRSELSPKFMEEYQQARDKETTIRYVVNEEGRMSACAVTGAKYPLCRTFLDILREIGESAGEGIDSFFAAIEEKMNADMAKKSWV